MEISWAAGFFDGEGNTNAYLGRGRSHWNLQLKVSQIHRPTLERFRDALGGVGKIYGPYNTTTGVQPQWCYKAVGAEAADVIGQMWDHLTPVKRLQALHAIGRWTSTKRPPPDQSETARRRRAYKASWARAKRERERGVLQGN